MSQNPQPKLKIIAKYIRQCPFKLWDLAKSYKKTTIAICISCLFLFALMKYQNKLLYHPVAGFYKSQMLNPHGYKNPSEMGMSYQDIEIVTDDKVNLRGWLIKHDKPVRLIVYFHENAGNIGERMQFLKAFTKFTQSDILLIAYRGYSDSDGYPTQSGLKKDSIAILSKALQLNRSKYLYIFGRSLGGATAVYSASQPIFNKKVDGIILQNTFTSIDDVVVNLFLPLRFFRPILWLILRNHWNSLLRIQHLSSPIYFIKSAKDELIPKKLMDQLHHQAEKFHKTSFQHVILQGTHNVSWSLNMQQYFDKLNDFFNHIELQKDKNKGKI